jgi:hypothetical protein
MRRRPMGFVSRHRSAILLAAIFILFAAYIGAYLLDVQIIVPPAPGRVISGSHLVTFQDFSAPLGPPDRIPTRPAGYRYGGQFAAAFFQPANWVDRKLRYDTWRYFGLPSQDITIHRTIHRAMQLDPSFHAAASNLLDLMDRRNMLMTTSSEYQTRTAALLQAAAKLEAACDRWEGGR